MYSDLVYVRDEKCDGIGPWTWIKTDNGAWDGPRRDWENSHKQNIQKYVTDWSICVQAGGNQGVYPNLLSAMFNDVYTFEPDPLNFYCLVDNCQKDNIYKLQAAVGKQSGLCRVVRNNMDNTGMHKVDDKSGFVPMLTIDSLKLPSCGLIALDVERYEQNALEGALETIERCKPVIQCEVGTDAILDLVRPFGYDKVAQSVSDTFYKVV